MNIFGYKNLGWFIIIIISIIITIVVTRPYHKHQLCKHIIKDSIKVVYGNDFTILGDDTLFNHGDTTALYYKTGIHKLEHLADILNLTNAMKVSFGGYNGELIVNDIVYTNWNNKKTIEKINRIYNDSAYIVDHYHFYNPLRPTQTLSEFEEEINLVYKTSGGMVK